MGKVWVNNSEKCKSFKKSNLKNRDCKNNILQIKLGKNSTLENFLEQKMAEYLLIMISLGSH